jgi:hypothetical protein
MAGETVCGEGVQGSCCEWARSGISCDIVANGSFCAPLCQRNSTRASRPTAFDATSAGNGERVQLILLQQLQKNPKLLLSTISISSFWGVNKV